MEFLGHDTNYWLELEEQAQKLAVVKWIEEVAKLRAKVSFYESRILEMEEFKNSFLIKPIVK